MRYEAPAKINLNLLVSPRDESGMHPLSSVVQTVELCDTLDVTRSDSDELVLEGIEVPAGPENLVVQALEELRRLVEVPPVSVKLEKMIPIEAGLGGGSADAAAMLVAGADLVPSQPVELGAVAPLVGSDVAFPLKGGTAEITGYGESVRSLSPLRTFAVALVVPSFGLSTPAVYRKWDDLGGPAGFEVPDRFLPPELRHGFPVRNDLYRAAVEVEPALGDFVRDVGRAWDAAVIMTGSGSACFGFFPSSDEAEEAARSIPGTRAAFGADLRTRGVARIND